MNFSLDGVVVFLDEGINRQCDGYCNLSLALEKLPELQSRIGGRDDHLGCV